MCCLLRQIIVKSGLALTRLCERKKTFTSWVNLVIVRSFKFVDDEILLSDFSNESYYGTALSCETVHNSVHGRYHV